MADTQTAPQAPAGLQPIPALGGSIDEAQEALRSILEPEEETPETEEAQPTEEEESQPIEEDKSFEEEPEEEAEEELIEIWSSFFSLISAFGLFVIIFEEVPFFSIFQKFHFKFKFLIETPIVLKI